MMAYIDYSVKVICKITYRSETPTGELCECCGDPCYLEQYRPVINLWFDGKPNRPDVCDFVFCGACCDDDHGDEWKETA